MLEITRCNQWVKVSTVSKFTNCYHIKFECDQVRTTNQCLKHGVPVYSFSYPPRMISLHQHKTSASNLKNFCLRCYAYNDRLTMNYTKHRDYKTRSECSGDHKKMYNLFRRGKMIQYQQNEINRSVPSSAPTPLNHRSAPSYVNLPSLTLFANVVKKMFKITKIRRMMLSKDL